MFWCNSTWNYKCVDYDGLFVVPSKVRKLFRMEKDVFLALLDGWIWEQVFVQITKFKNAHFKKDVITRAVPKFIEEQIRIISDLS